MLHYTQLLGQEPDPTHELLAAVADLTEIGLRQRGFRGDGWREILADDRKWRAERRAERLRK